MKCFGKLLALALSIIMLVTLIMPVSAASAPAKTDTGILEALGMLIGEGNGVTAEYLAKECTRIQGAILLLRLLGKEEEAKAYVPEEGEVNFADADTESQGNKTILAYLKAHPEIGFQGIGNNLFAPKEKITREQYTKILLTVLGCASGAPGDFTSQGLSAVASGNEVIVATDRSPAEWKSKAAFICPQGELSSALRLAIQFGNATFKFAPGEYLIEGPTKTIWVGSNTKLLGATPIVQPVKQEDMLYPNSATQAVFITRTSLSSTQEAGDLQTGLIRTVSGAENVTISNIALSGYTVLKLDNASKCKIDHVLIHNYRGTYPYGRWCNMGYGRATGSLWIFGSCSDIVIQNCQIQCSSHHGLTIHSGSNQYISKNIFISGCRALYCGCGQLRGQSAAEIRDAEIRVPETKGYGYRDWSVAFDLCENQSVENVTLEDCYALEGWKCGFYTEPEDSGGNIKNLKLIRCRSDKAGQRAVIPGSNPKATIPSETEGSNFYMQGGYFEDCISVEGEKCGWYLNPNRTGANSSDNAKIKMVRCGDMGSPISLVTEMTDSSNLHSDGFWSFNAKDYAMWLFGSTDFKLDNNLILAANRRNSPIKIGYMLRQQLRESRNPQNQMAVRPGGKYDVLRAELTDSSVTGTIYNLNEAVSPVQIVSGASFNGQKTVLSGSSVTGVTLTVKNSGTIDTDKYLNPIIQEKAETVMTESPKEVFTVSILALDTVRALKMYIKGGRETLISKLVKGGSISEDKAVASGIYFK
ncbi:MAG: hypothetical protein ABFD25_19685 [Clostridiaceae bacterium]